MGRHTGKGEQWRARERCGEMKGRETEIERKGPWKKYFFPGLFSGDSLPPTRTYVLVKLSYLINGLLELLIRTVPTGSDH